MTKLEKTITQLRELHSTEEEFVVILWSNKLQEILEEIKEYIDEKVK